MGRTAPSHEGRTRAPCRTAGSTAIRAKASQRLIALALSAGLIAVGCGGDDIGAESEINKPEFIAQANQICADGSREIDREARQVFEGFGDDQEPSARQLDRFGAEVLLPGIRAQVDAIDDLARPDGDEEEIDQIIALARQGLTEAEQDPASLASEDGGPPEIAGAERRLVGYGVERCGS